MPKEMVVLEATRQGTTGGLWLAAVGELSSSNTAYTLNELENEWVLR